MVTIAPSPDVIWNVLPLNLNLCALLSSQHCAQGWGQWHCPEGNCRSLHGSMLLSEGKNATICPEIQSGVILGPRGPNECQRPGEEVSSTLVIPTTAISLLGMNSELLNPIYRLRCLRYPRDNAHCKWRLSPCKNCAWLTRAQSPPPSFLWSTGSTGNQSLLLPF